MVEGMTLHLGKLPARPDAVKLKLSSYFELPEIPAKFPDPGKVAPKAWGMLGNDEYGDCVIAGSMHEHMLWTREGVGTAANFTTANALSTYTAVTGFDPSQTDAQGNNPTDRGTDMEAMAKYRRKTGITDASGTVHKIGAYLALDHQDPTTLAAAAYIFDAVGVGIEFPSSAMDQFNAGRSWSVVKGSTNEGGHYVPLFFKKSAATFQVVTWGQVQNVTKGFITTYADEAIVYLSEEFLDGTGKTPDGFDLTALQNDLKAL